MHVKQGNLKLWVGCQGRLGKFPEFFKKKQGNSFALLGWFRYQTAKGSCTNWLTPVIPSDVLDPYSAHASKGPVSFSQENSSRMRWIRLWSLRCCVTLAKLLRLSEIVSCL